MGYCQTSIKALELLISKVLLAVAKVQEEIQLPKKPEEPLLLSKYPLIMELDVELKRRNEEIFAVEQERSNRQIELSECSRVFKQKKEEGIAVGHYAFG